MVCASLKGKGGKRQGGYLGGGGKHWKPGKGGKARLHSTKDGKRKHLGLGRGYDQDRLIQRLPKRGGHGCEKKKSKNITTGGNRGKFETKGKSGKRCANLLGSGPYRLQDERKKEREARLKPKRSTEKGKNRI